MKRISCLITMLISISFLICCNNDDPQPLIFGKWRNIGTEEYGNFFALDTLPSHNWGPFGTMDFFLNSSDSLYCRVTDRNYSMLGLSPCEINGNLLVFYPKTIGSDIDTIPYYFELTEDFLKLYNDPNIKFVHERY